MTATLVRLIRDEHPAVRSARLAIHEHAKALAAQSPAHVFALAAYAERLATGNEASTWWLSCEHAAQHPEQFTTGRRP